MSFHPYRPRPSSLVLVLDCPSSFALKKRTPKSRTRTKLRNEYRMLSVRDTRHGQLASESFRIGTVVGSAAAKPALPRELRLAIRMPAD